MGKACHPPCSWGEVLELTADVSEPRDDVVSQQIFVASKQFNADRRTFVDGAMSARSDQRRAMIVANENRC